MKKHLLFLFALFAIKSFADPSAWSYYSYNGASSIAVSSGTTLTLTRVGLTSTYPVTLGAGSAPYTVQLVLSDTAVPVHAGDRLEIPVSYPASTNPALYVYDSGTGGALLHSSTGAAIAGNAILHFLNVTGTAWSFTPGGEMLNRNLGAGVQVMLGQPAADARAFGALEDGTSKSDGVVTTGAGTLSSASTTFLPTDIGKGIAAYTGSSCILTGSITSILSTTSILTSGSATASGTFSWMYGTINTTAINTGGSNGNLYISDYNPGGIYIIKGPLLPANNRTWRIDRNARIAELAGAAPASGGVLMSGSGLSNFDWHGGIWDGMGQTQPRTGGAGYCYQENFFLLNCLNVHGDDFTSRDPVVFNILASGTNVLFTDEKVDDSGVILQDTTSVTGNHDNIHWIGPSYNIGCVRCAAVPGGGTDDDFISIDASAFGLGFSAGAIADVFIDDCGEIGKMGSEGVGIYGGYGCGVDSVRIKGLCGQYDQAAVFLCPNIASSGVAVLSNITIECTQAGKLGAGGPGSGKALIYISNYSGTGIQNMSVHATQRLSSDTTSAPAFWLDQYSSASSIMIDGLNDTGAATGRDIIRIGGTCGTLVLNNVSAALSSIGNHLIDMPAGCNIGALTVTNAATTNVQFWLGPETGTQTIGTATFAECTGSNCSSPFIWNTGGSTIGALNLLNDTFNNFSASPSDLVWVNNGASISRINATGLKAVSGGYVFNLNNSGSCAIHLSQFAPSNISGAIFTGTGSYSLNCLDYPFATSAVTAPQTNDALLISGSGVGHFNGSAWSVP